MDLLTVHETAAELKLNPKTVRRYIESGRLPAVRIGRRLRIERTALEALARPVRPGEALPAAKANPIGPQDTMTILTAEEVAEALAAMREAEAFREAMQARRGGKPLPDSWPVIREEREARSRQL